MGSRFASQAIMPTHLRLALRTLRSTPAFTLVIVATLGLGIGATTAMFSVIHGVLLAPPPIRDIDRVAMIWQTDRASGTTREPASIPDYADVRRMATTVESMAGFYGTDANVTPTEGDPFRLPALVVTHEFLPLLGIEPLAGRLFTAAEDTPWAPHVAMIGARFWQREFGGDPHVTHRSLRLDGVPHAIVGVLPDSADFGVLQVLSGAAYGRAFADRGRQEVEVWLPLRADPATASRETHDLFVVGRLAPGVPVAAARDEMARIAAELEQAYPRSNRSRGAFVEPLGDVVLGPVRPALAVLMAAVVLVLLVACVNVASLLLARSAARARETAIRTALGAGTWHLLRQSLAEGLVLAGAGAIAGLLFAGWVTDVMVALAPPEIPRLSAVSTDVTVLAATLSIALLVAFLMALPPALQARRLCVEEMLKAENGRTGSAGPSRRRVHQALIVAQFGLAIVLTIGAGLLMKSFWHLRSVDPGFRAGDVLKLEYSLPETRYAQSRETFPNWPRVRRFHEELLRRTSELPQVQAAAVAAHHPLAGGFTSSVVVVGREAAAGDWPEISLRFVSAGYLQVTGLPLLHGRDLADSDDAQAPLVVLINESARLRFFAEQDPLGQQIAFWGTGRTVVGVVGNEKIHGLEHRAPPAAYVPFAQAPLAGTLLVRVTRDPMAIAPAIRGVFRELDPALAVFGVEPLRQTVADSLAERRFTMLLLGSFAALTLLLAAVGIYGVVSHSVAQRTREIGVRLALGAEPGRIVRHVVGRALVAVVIGLGTGLAGALMLARWLDALLFGVAAADPVIVVGAVLVLTLVATAATYLPARRASKVDPVVALRPE
jgi:putative ABC transport system permease protein